MSMKIILVDTSKTFLSEVRQYLAARLPAVEITEYDAEQQGTPTGDFRWELYDFALISEELGDGRSGLAWIKGLISRPDFPPTVLVSASGNEYFAIEAIRAGARDYLRREDVPGPRLVDIVCALPLGNDGNTRGLEPQVKAALEDHTRSDLPAASGHGHRFVRLIGQGGFSRVYLAERENDGEQLVLKIIDTDQISDPLAVQRFIREAEIIAGLTDPHVVRVFDQGFTPDYGYISMEFFQQGDLKRRIERGVNPAQAVAYMRSIARGLSAIHARGVIHRDLKPGNIMFRTDGSLALADFGIAKRINETQDLTAASGVLGTPSYLSPEQAMGTQIDCRADLYSAGVIFFELLTGRKPYKADSAAGLVYQHLHANIPRMPEALAPLQPVIDLLLAKDPADRFSSAQEFLATLEEWLPPGFERRLPLAGGAA